MYGTHIPIYYDKLKKKIVSNFNPESKMDGVVVNPEELQSLANSHHDGVVPPMCIWYNNSVVLTTLTQNKILGYFIIPRYPKLFNPKFLIKTKSPYRTNTTYGKFLKYKGRDGIRNLHNIIYTDIIKQSVDGDCDGVCWWSDDNGYRLSQLSEIKEVCQRLPPMCIWCTKSILLLSKCDGNYYIYKIPRNPIDYEPDYIQIN